MKRVFRRPPVGLELSAMLRDHVRARRCRRRDRTCRLHQPVVDRRRAVRRRRTAPRQRTIAFTAAAWTVTFVVGLALALGLGDLILALVPKPGRTSRSGLITAAGVVLMIGGAVVWIRRRSLVSAEASDDRHESHQPAALMGAPLRGTGTAHRVSLLRRHRDDCRLRRVGRRQAVPAHPVLRHLHAAVDRDRRPDRGDGEARQAVPRTPSSNWCSAHWPVVVGPLTAAFGVGVLAFGRAGPMSSS